MLNPHIFWWVCHVSKHGAPIHPIVDHRFPPLSGGKLASLILFKANVFFKTTYRLWCTNWWIIVGHTDVQPWIWEFPPSKADKKWFLRGFHDMNSMFNPLPSLESSWKKNHCCCLNSGSYLPSPGEFVMFHLSEILCYQFGVVQLF